MAVPGAIVAASLWTRDPEKKYPLAGLIFSGWGTGMKPLELSAEELPAPEAETWKPSTTVKKLMMLSDDKYACFESTVLSLIEPQNVPMPMSENMDGRLTWFEYGPQCAKEVNVPIMYGVGEHDWPWEGGMQYVKEFETWFPDCPRFDGSTVLGAPHALEWSKASRGWYARCFGWAIEVCAGRTA